MSCLRPRPALPRLVLLGLALTLGVPSRPARAAAPLVQTLTLEDALRRFRDGSPTAQQLAGRVAEAHATVRLSMAPALPVVALNGGYTRNRDDAVVSMSKLFEGLQDSLPVEIDTKGFPSDPIIQPLEQWTAAASVSVPLIAPQAWLDIAASRRASEAAENSVEYAIVSAESALVKASWLAHAAELQLQAAQHAEEAATRHRDTAERHWKAGTGTELELLVAETELSKRRSDAAQADADLDHARRALGALLGLSGAVVVRPDLDGLDRAAPDAETAAGTALRLRPDLHAAQSQQAAARLAQRSAWWRHAPTLSGTATLFGSDVAYPTGETDGWRLGLNATWVLFDGGARYGMLGVARAREAQAQGSIAQLELDAERQAQDAVAAIDVARRRLALATQGLETAQRAEGTAERLYTAGLLSSLDAIDAVQRRLDAEVGRAGALARLGMAHAELDVATGRRAGTP